MLSLPPALQQTVLGISEPVRSAGRNILVLRIIPVDEVIYLPGLAAIQAASEIAAVNRATSSGENDGRVQINLRNCEV